MNAIQQTIDFLLDLFEKSEYLKDKPQSKEYRLNHSFRVAHIGKEIALHENLNVEAVVVGCLLHDISYINAMNTDEDRINHGRTSAHLVRPFVMSLDMNEQLKKELLYGIAIHVDDQADFEGERTILAETIGEADNIDRFDRYRLYEGLLYSNLDQMNTTEQMKFISTRLERLRKLKNTTFKTKTAQAMWNEKLDVQISYYNGLFVQLEKNNYQTLLK